MKRNQLDIIGYVDDQLVEKADQYASKKKTNMMIKWGTAACLCLTAIAALLIWTKYMRKPSDEIVYTIEATAESSIQVSMEEPAPKWPGSLENEEIEMAEEPAPDPWNEGEPKEEIETEAESLPDIENETNEINDPVVVEFKEGVISAFWESSFDSDLAVMNGEIAYSDSLCNALAACGEDVWYYIVVEIFQDGIELDPLSEEGEQEYLRLSELGYDVFIETNNDGYIEQNFLAMEASMAQVTEFPVTEEFGYYLVFFNEVMERVLHED